VVVIYLSPWLALLVATVPVDGGGGGAGLFFVCPGYEGSPRGVLYQHEWSPVEISISAPSRGILNLQIKCIQDRHSHELPFAGSSSVRRS